MTPKQINRIVARHFGVPARDITGTSQRNEIIFPREAAMLICRTVLGYRYMQLQKAYNKSAHSTISNALRSARNLYETNSGFKQAYDKSHSQVVDLMPKLQTTKQRYNLHYRLRQHKVRITTKNKTVSLMPEQATDLEQNRQLTCLVRAHSYQVQYALL